MNTTALPAHGRGSFNPFGQPRPCAACQHYGGAYPSTHQGVVITRDRYAWCKHGNIVHHSPASGCAFWSGTAQ